MKFLKSNKGDTLVEVLLATVVLSAVLAAAFTLSNRATKLNLQAFERTQITSLMQQQAELVRSARDSFIPSAPAGLWVDIKGKAHVVDPRGAICDVGNLTSLPTDGRITGSGFHIDESYSLVNGLVPSQPIFSVWAEIENGPGNEYWDVHVFGCWPALGNQPTNVSELVFRLEDPR